MESFEPPPPAPSPHLLHHLLEAGHVGGAAPALHLLHHVLETRHPSHLFQHPWVHHSGHLTVYLVHVSWIHLKGLTMFVNNKQAYMAYKSRLNMKLKFID